MSFTSQFTPYSFPLQGLVRLPTVTITPEQRASAGVKANASNVAFLKKLCWQRYLDLKARGQMDDIDEKAVIDRLKFEFGVLEKTGTIDYLLIMWDICRYCDQVGIPRGPGRGSVCGSMVCYLAGITKINSLRYNLNFTRFISEARVKPKVIDGVVYADGRTMCDIDGDFSAEQYGKVLAYIESKFPNRTAKIGTVTSLTGKTALKDTLKVYCEWDETQAKMVTDLIEVKYGKTESLKEAFDKSKAYKAWVEADPLHARAHQIAMGIEGLVRGKGVHASGFFMSYDVLDNTLPVQRIKVKKSDEDEEEEGTEEHIATVYNKDEVAEIGVKWDILKLKTVDAIKKTCDILEINADDIDINDPSIYNFIEASRHYNGAFQIDVGLAGDATHKAKPKTIHQLSATISIARPGSLKDIPTLVEYYTSGKMKTLYPPIDALLKDTGGIIIYQESINDICQHVYGLSAVDAEEVSRAIRKKKREDIAKWEGVLREQGKKMGVPDEVTTKFWDTCDASADYLFSVNHGLPYSCVTAQTVWLKANHIKEFYLGLLQTVKSKKMQAIIAEAPKLGVAILPPDITRSQADFSIEPEGVRFGLSHIRGISDQTMSRLTSFKRDFRHKLDIFDAAQEAKLTISVVVGLIYSGCISIPGVPRTKLAIEAQMYNLFTDRERDIVARFTPDYDYDLIELMKHVPGKLDEKGKPYIKESRMETFRRDLKPYWAMYQANARHEELASYLMERHYLGFSYSNTLFNLYARKTEGLVPVAEVLTEPKGTKVSFVAFVDEVKKGVGKTSKKAYVRFHVSEESGAIKVMLSGDKVDKCAQFNGELPKEGQIVVVHGSTADSGDMVFADSIIVQPQVIKLKKDGSLEA